MSGETKSEGSNVESGEDGEVEGLIGYEQDGEERSPGPRKPEDKINMVLSIDRFTEGNPTTMKFTIASDKPLKDYEADDTSVAIITIKYAKDYYVEETDILVKAILGEEVLVFKDAVVYTAIDAIKYKKEITKLVEEACEDPHNAMMMVEERKNRLSKIIGKRPKNGKRSKEDVPVSKHQEGMSESFPEAVSEPVASRQDDQQVPATGSGNSSGSSSSS